MVDAFGSLQYNLTLALSVGTLVLALFALLDALRHRADAFPATSNQTKMIWLAILGIGLAFAVIDVPGFGMFSIASAVAAGVYLARVRPALLAIGGRTRRSRRR